MMPFRPTVSPSVSSKNGARPTSPIHRDARIEEVLAPFRRAVDRLMTTPGVGRGAAEVILAEIGPDMSPFPTAVHLLSWAGVVSRLDELSAAWRRRDERFYSPLPALRAFGWIAPPTMPSADFCVAVRPPCDDLSPVAGTQRRPPEVRPTAFAARPPDLPPRSLMAIDFAIIGSLVRPGRPPYPVLVHRAAALLHASFRRHLAMTPLRFANPSPPSGWIEDFNLQAIDHARHTKKKPGC
jgi:hypothetical protein